MAVIKKSEMKKMSPNEMKTKMADIRKSMLELAGEGHKDKIKPLKKAIAALQTHMHNAPKALNTKKVK